MNRVEFQHIDIHLAVSIPNSPGVHCPGVPISLPGVWGCDPVLGDKPARCSCEGTRTIEPDMSDEGGIIRGGGMVPSLRGRFTS
jgi:hypothetical protein